MKKTPIENDAEKENDLRFLDVENWRVPTKKELINYYQSVPKKQKTPGTLISFQKHLSPIDVYTYLKARFGEPNGYLNSLKSPSSDNLIHWDYLLICEGVAINIMGKHRAVDFMIQKDVTDDNWRQLVTNFRGSYRKYASGKTDVLKSLEEWSVFVNRYSELCSEAAIQHEKITRLENFEFKMPPVPAEEGKAEEWQQETQRLTTNFHELQQACLALKLLTPILLEAFINLLILVLCKKEIRENKTVYEARVREELHVKIPSMHITCDHFSRPIDTVSSEYKNFSRIMNSRNWFFHGNADPKKDKLETVYFEGNTPIYKKPGDVHDRFFGTLLSMIQPKKIIEDYVKAHEFIIYVVNCIKREHREHVWCMLNSTSLGYNEKEERFGVLFADLLVSSYLPGLKTDELLFNEN